MINLILSKYQYGNAKKTLILVGPVRVVDFQVVINSICQKKKNNKIQHRCYI